MKHVLRNSSLFKFKSSYHTQCLKDIQNKEKIVSEENNGDIL